MALCFWILKENFVFSLSRYKLELVCLTVDGMPKPSLIEFLTDTGSTFRLVLILQFWPSASLLEFLSLLAQVWAPQQLLIYWFWGCSNFFNSLMTVAGLTYELTLDGISNTTSIETISQFLWPPFPSCCSGSRYESAAKTVNLQKIALLPCDQSTMLDNVSEPQSGRTSQNSHQQTSNTHLALFFKLLCHSLQRFENTTPSQIRFYSCILAIDSRRNYQLLSF